MSVMQQPSATGEYIIYRQRRGVELVLTLIACTFGVVGWVVSYLSLRGTPPDNLIPGTLIWFGMALAAHFGDGVLRAEDVAAGIVGAVVKDPVADHVIWQEYLQTVVRERVDWKDFYRACRQVAR